MTAAFSKAQEVSFPVLRPAFSNEAHQSFLRYRSQNPPGLIVDGDRCPAQVALIKKIIIELSNKNGLDHFLKAEPGLRISIGCGYRNFELTGLKNGGVILLPGAVIGKLSDEDQIAFILAHEVSHYLLAHDEQALFWQMTNFEVDSISLKQRESDADTLALLLMSRSGYNPSSGLEVIQILSGCIFGIFCNDEPPSGHLSYHQRNVLLKLQISTLKDLSKKRIISHDLRSAQTEWKILSR